MRNQLRLGLSLATLAGLSAVSLEARADDATTSTAPAAVKFEQTTGLGTGITTGPLGNDLATIEVALSLDPVDGGGPLFSVNMPKGALIQASWGTDKTITFKAQTGATSDGVVTVRHTLAPTVDLQIKKVFPVKVHYDATDLIKAIPTSKFNFDAKASQAFSPWAFNGIDTKLVAPSLEDSSLFSIGMDKLPAIIADNVTGAIGVAATTTPTFTYKTTKIFLSGINGEIDNITGTLTAPATDGDYIEIMAAVEGEMQAKGAVTIAPYLRIDKVQDTKFGTIFDFPAISKDYVTPVTKVPFQTVTVHIPMPNVRAPKSGLSIGDVKVGSTGTRKVTIENSGEKEAVARFDSSDPQFTVPGGSVTIPARGTYDLAVGYAPENANPASATITIRSNDADSPEQTFKVGANGADVGDPAQTSTADGADGCGCRAAGARSPSAAWASLGLVGLGLALLGRRRRAR